jgi:hypothetical protein
MSITRFPRGFVSINGTQVYWKDFTVTNTRYGSADTYTVNIPVSSLPKSLPLPTLISTSPVTVQIKAGIVNLTNPNNATASDVPLIVLGDADSITYDPKKATVTISGRDYISRFIENKIAPPIVGTSPAASINLPSIIQTNPTSSFLVSYIATNRQLTPNVATTTNPIGYYLNNPQNLFSMLNNNITEWDLMCYLARQESFDIYIIGTVLYFQPSSDDTPYKINITTPFYSNPGEIPQSNLIDIQLKRNMRLAKNIIVNIYSRDVFNNTTIQSSASLVHSDEAASTGQATVYNYVFPNINQAQANTKAQNLLLDISQHEMNIQFKIPADPNITPHSVIAVVGTNSIYDQNYYVKSVTTEMAANSGFNMTVTAVNHSPNTTTVTGQ